MDGVYSYLSEPEEGCVERMESAVGASGYRRKEHVMAD